MHTAIVDIAIQENSAKALTSHFHTVVPFHDLLTIWFSFGQNKFCVQGNGIYSLRFSCLCIHRLSFSDEKPALSFFKEHFLLEVVKL